MTNYNYSEFEACSWNGQPMFDLGTTISTICECSCVGVEEETTTTVVGIAIISH